MYLLFWWILFNLFVYVDMYFRVIFNINCDVLKFVFIKMKVGESLFNDCLGKWKLVI